MAKAPGTGNIGSSLRACIQHDLQLCDRPNSGFILLWPDRLLNLHPDPGVMNGRAFNASVKTLRFIVACHQRNQHSYPLRFAFSSQRSQQSLRNFPVPFAFQYADPVKVCTAAGCITSACDNRSIDSPNHLILFYSDERHGSIEPSIIKACFQLLAAKAENITRCRIPYQPAELFKVSPNKTPNHQDHTTN